MVFRCAVLATLLLLGIESVRIGQDPGKEHRRRGAKVKKVKAPRAPITTTTTTPRDIGPLYKCESVPTSSDKYLNCGQEDRKPWKEGQGKAACFSLVSTMKWFCPKIKDAPKWASASHNTCVKKRDRDSNLYDGRCVYDGHADYAKAVDYRGPGKLASRPVRKPTNWDPKAFLWYNEPKYSIKQPPIHANAIGWKPTDVVVAQGKWCEVGQPVKGWMPGRGLCKHSGTEVKVLSYNLYWWKLFNQDKGFGNMQKPDGGWEKVDRAAGRLIEMNGPFDFMGFQECDDVKRIVNDARLASKFDTYKGSNAIANAWRRDTWKSLQNGYEDVTEDYQRNQWSGRRGVVWSRLQNKKNGQVVFFVNHHGPLPDNSGGYCGPHAAVYRILKVISERAHKGDVVILAGDFNAMGASTVTNVLDQHLKNSYHGKSFDGVDKFYHNCPESIKVLKKQNLGLGGSDHDALAVTYEI